MNKALAIIHLHPSAIPMIDFVVQDDGEGQFIAEWNLPDPQPSETELQTAWDDLQANPPIVPPTQSEFDRQRISDLELVIADAYERGIL